MKLNWFSPLPPAATDIGHYTARLLPALRERAAITLWTDQATWEPQLEADACVRPYRVDETPWDDLNRADLTVYHLGNDARFHRAIWQVSRQHPGLVILHDPRMQEFFAAVHSATSAQRDAYAAHMVRYYGPEGAQAAQDLWDGKRSVYDLAVRHPLSGLACENALAVLVHSQHPLPALRGEISCPIIVAALPYPASPRRPEARRPGPPYRIVVFGYLGRNRGLGHVLRALADSRARDQFRLDVYGPVADAESIGRLIASLQLGRLVVLHGDTRPEVLDRRLQDAHLAINLRHPTMGESSGSQLRIWDHALPSLVSRIDWYGTLPEDAVAFVRPGSETEDLQMHLQAFLADPLRFTRMGERGRRVLEARHSPDAYVEAILAVARKVWHYHRHAVASRLARRAGRQMGVWMDPDALESPYRTAAVAIDALLNGSQPVPTEGRCAS